MNFYSGRIIYRVYTRNLPYYFTNDFSLSFMYLKRMASTAQLNGGGQWMKLAGHFHVLLRKYRVFIKKIRLFFGIQVI